MTEPINMNVDAPTEEPIDLNVAPKTFVPDDVAAKRAAKAEYGLTGKVDKTYDDYHRAIITGEEEKMRTEIASYQGYINTVNKYRTITAFAAAKQHNLTTEELDNLHNFTDTPSVEPSTVFEANYADSYTKALKEVPGFPGSWYDTANQEMPEQVQQTERITNSFIAKKEYARTQKENASTVVSDQSYVGWTADQLKMLFPGYVEGKMRGNVPGVSAVSGLLGTQMDMEARKLLELPFPEFKVRFDAIMANYKKTNPSLAVMWAGAVEGQSLGEQSLNNAFTMLDVSGIYGVGKAIGKLGAKVLGKATLYNDVRQMNKEIAKSAIDADHQPPSVTLPAAAGDLATAAVEKVTANTVAALKGASNPEKEAVEAMVSVLDGDMTKAQSNLGRFQEIGNRLTERAVNFKTNFLDAVTKMQRVERIPLVAATKDMIRKVKEDFINSYPGLRNSILDINSQLKIGDLALNRVTNTYTLEMQIGRHTGEYFLSKDEARGAANLNGIVLKGDLTAEQTARKIYLDNAIQAGKVKLNEYNVQKSIIQTESGIIPPDLQFRIDNLTKGLPKYEKELAAIQGSKEGGEIKAKGWGFYISVSKPLNETSKVVRDFLLSTKEARTPDSWLNTYMGWLRTPEETLSLEQRLNRKVAAYTGSVLLKVAKEEAKSIRALTRFAFPGTAKKEAFLQWERMVKAGRDIQNPITGKPGYFFKTVNEMDEFYRTNFNRGITEPEIHAYQSFVRLIEMDRSLRNIELYRNMSRIGTEQHSIHLLGKNGEKIASEFFPGIRQNTFPIGEDAILVMGENVGEHKVYNPTSKQMSGKNFKQLQDEVQKGERQVIRIYDPERRPLQDLVGSDSRIRYVISKKGNIESKNISFDQIPRQEGGHFDYDYDHYIKQANVKYDSITDKHWYEGDSTVMPIMNRALGTDIAKILDEVRVALKAKDIDAAKAAAARLTGTSGIPWKNVEGWFKPSKGPGGKIIAARLNLDQSIQVVPKGRMIVDMDNVLKNKFQLPDRSGKIVDKFKDGTKQGSDARQFQVEYTGERDAHEVFTIRDEGTLHNPLYKYEPAKLVDPIPTMNRALTKIINSTFMDDYKIFSVEHWLAEAGQYIKGDWKSSPFWFFEHGEFVPGIPIDVRRKLEDARFKIKQFTGTPSTVQALLDKTSQDLADTIYRKFGATGLTSKVLLAPTWAIQNLTKPIDFLHTVTYHAVIGMFSVPQLLVQSMTYVTIFGIAGPNAALRGTLGAALHQYARLSRNPEILKNLDLIASRMGFRPGEFLEANETLGRTGFENVAGEHILSDHFYQPKIVSNGVANFLDASTIFFKGAERNARYGAWYTAFKEFRDVHPTGALTNHNINEILERAELLAGNMSRASKSTLQTGIMSFPSQFLAYQLRLAEQFLGHRLTSIEKTRLIATYAAMYGVPTAVGVAGFPLGDFMRKAALENGYVVGKDFVETLVNQGIPAALGQLATGHVYDVGQRLGTPGVDVFRDVLTGDKPWWSLVGGASGSLLSGAWEQSDGFRTAMMSAIRGDNEAFPMTTDTFTDPFKVISSWSRAQQTLAAIYTHRWMSRNENVTMSDVSPMNAVFMGLTGLQTQEAANTMHQAWSLKDRVELQKNVEKEFIKYFRRGLRSQNDDPDQARAHFTQAFAFLRMGDFPDEKVAQAIAIALEDNTDLPSRLNWDMYMKNVPPSKKEMFMNTFNQIQQVKH